MFVINEVQTSTYYTQDIPEEHLRTLVEINALVHVQTSVGDGFVHRYFATPKDAHPYTLKDYRSLGEFFIGPINLEPERRPLVEQIVSTF